MINPPMDRTAAVMSWMFGVMNVEFLCKYTHVLGAFANVSTTCWDLLHVYVRFSRFLISNGTKKQQQRIVIAAAEVPSCDVLRLVQMSMSNYLRDLSHAGSYDYFFSITVVFGFLCA